MAPPKYWQKVITNFVLYVSLLGVSSNGFMRSSITVRRPSMVRLRSLGELVGKPIPSPSITDIDRQYMQQALKLAARTKRDTFPNPAVGCVIVGPNTQGVGWHPKAGWPHAEVYALADYCGILPTASRSVELGDPPVSTDDTSSFTDEETLLVTYLNKGSKMFKDKAKGCTAYVTLEPCCHKQGSEHSGGPKKITPPCANSLLKAGVARVVIGCRDPNSLVNGGGVHLLTDADIEVAWIGGQEETDARELISQFTARMKLPKNVTMSTNVRAKLKTFAHTLHANKKLVEVTASRRDPMNPRWLAEVDSKLVRELVWVKGLKDKKMRDPIAKILGATNIHSIGGSMLLFRPQGKKLKIAFFSLDSEMTLTFTKDVIVPDAPEKKK